MNRLTRTKRVAAASALILGGIGIGAAAIGSGAANAADTSTTSSSGTSGPSGTAPDPSKPVRSDEKLLTGDTKAKVIAAALAKYPGATIERAETDSDGVYEAHIVTKAGAHVIVQVGSDFTVTGTQTGGPGAGGKGGRGGPGGPGGTRQAPPAGSTPPAA